MSFDYPAAELEQRIVMHESGTDRDTAHTLVRLAAALRHLGGHDIEEAPSTRLLVHAARLIGSGIAPLQACAAALAEPLTDDPTTRAAILDVVRLHFADARATSLHLSH
jgi:nitric oxide reductase NorQ protein